MLVFQGELVDGFSLEQAKSNFRTLYRISHDKVEELFARSFVVLKKDLTHDSALEIKDNLHQNGLIANIQPMETMSVPDELEDEAETVAFEFHGKGGEFFKIWIVNVFLSILTLGIYSAWAKVRTHRYFYSNTQLGNHSFEYTASPITILKGRIIAAVFFATYYFIVEMAPMLAPVFMLVFFVVFPLLLCRSLAFRNRNSVYRNIRFGFDGTYFEAVKAFILWPMLLPFTLGLIFPYIVYKQKAFIVGNTRFGTIRFNPRFESGEFYSIYFIALAIIILGVVVSTVMGMLTGLVELLPMLLITPLYLYTIAYINAESTNLVYNKTQIKQHGFLSTVTVGRLIWLYLTNALLMVTLVGIPWAMVRMANFSANHLNLQSRGSLDNFVAAEEQKVGSLGEEIGDMFDMEIGL
jgi:uncharacterized membrane protein YjgN (DUF898 family)